MNKEPSTCLACGARLAEDATRCDLCGTPALGAEAAETAEMAHPLPPLTAEAAEAAPTPPVPEAAPPMPAPAAPAPGVFCNACGWKNPPGARYCSQCGQPLQQLNQPPGQPPAGRLVSATAALPAGPPAGHTTSDNIPDDSVSSDSASGDGAMTSQLGIIVGSGVLLVVALFMITIISKSLDQPPAAPTAEAPTAEPLLPPPTSETLPDEVAEAVAALEAEIAALDGPERLFKQEELVDLYFEAGRLDLAGDAQQQIAEAQNTEAAWIQVGNLYYDWMEGLTGQGRSFYAQKAIAGYERALEINPDNLDVRTDMAIAYLYDPTNPMKAIQQTNMVLEKDSSHLQANFNRGIMLMQINRLDQAIEQFQKVKLLIGDTNDPVYQRADAAIDAVRNLQNDDS